MEFFSDINNIGIEVNDLQALLTMDKLPVYCASIDTLISQQDESKAEIYCVWGQFSVSRELIRNGVRFALLNCPHALAWTIAYHEKLGSVVVHCTIDDREEETEFIETIEQFVDDWASGLEPILLHKP